MDLHRSNRAERGLTFVELLLALAIGTMMLAIVGSVCLQVSRTSSSLFGFTSLSARDRSALEKLGRDFRNAEALANLNQTNMSLLVGGNVIRFAFHRDEHRLYRFAGTTSEVLLPNCRSLQFTYHAKKPNAFDSYNTTTAACKVVRVTWTSALDPKRASSPDVLHSAQFMNRQP